MNFKIDETHTKKKNTIVICDLITTLDADDTTKTKREEEIPFKVTLMRCVSYKIQMVENKIQHELMNCWCLFILFQMTTQGNLTFQFFGSLDFLRVISSLSHLSFVTLPLTSTFIFLIKFRISILFPLNSQLNSLSNLSL